VCIVLDGVGVGEAPDAAAFGDRGSNSLGNTARHVGASDAYLDEKGISYREEGDALILNEDARVVIANHAKGLTRTFKRLLRPVIWGRAGWVVSTVFKVG